MAVLLYILILSLLFLPSFSSKIVDVYIREQTRIGYCLSRQIYSYQV